jgi:CBS domain containing-hemolysin-like protein
MGWLLILFTIAITATLTAAETSISRQSLAHLEDLSEDNPTRYARLIKIVTDKPKYVNTLLVLQAFGWSAATVLILQQLDRNQGTAALWATTGIMTFVGFVILGVGARTIGRQHADKVGVSLAPLVSGLAALLAPLVRLLILIGNAITPGKGFEEGPFVSTAALRELMDQASESVIQDDERKMLQSVFDLGDTVAREVMVPRTEMVWIEGNKTLRQAMSLALRSGYSRIPVVGEDVDDIIGVVYLKDIARRIFEHSESQQSERVQSIMRPTMFAPDSKRVDDLLREMQSRRTHLAVLVDEYGGTAGLVTIEDVIEEIVGEIADEYDTAEAEVVRLSDTEYSISSRLHIEDLAELIGIELDADDEGIDTVAGLMAARLGRVAIPGSVIEIEGWTIHAESAAGRRNKVGRLTVSRETIEVIEE